MHRPGIWSSGPSIVSASSFAVHIVPSSVRARASNPQISETAFVQCGAADAGQSVRFEFDTGPDGEVAGLRALYDGCPFLAEFPHLQRLREIPRGTEGDCLQTI
jgi:hypothetical protein